MRQFRDDEGPMMRQALLLILVLAVFPWDRACADERIVPKPLPASVVDDFANHRRGPHVLADPDFRIWGLSVIRWSDGKYHGYYGRWPKELGHDGWLTDTEIVHSVADRPEGPFVPTGVIVASRNALGWDLANAHNSYAIVADSRICLYYISNKLAGKFKPVDSNPLPPDEWLRDKARNWKTIRNSQCIGVAIADRPEGPFVRAEKPVVEPSADQPFTNIAVNPAVLFRNGRYVMIMKGDDRARSDESRWFRIQLVGHSDRPEGPFAFQTRPVYSERQTEDAGLFYNQYERQYFMVCHVMGTRDLALFSSQDSYKWAPATQRVLMQKQFQLEDGTVWKPGRVERPFVLTENGQPTMLYVAVGDKDRNGNIAVPLEVGNGN